MNTEKDMLTQDLARQEKPEEIKQFIEDTELMGGHEDIIELAKAKLDALNKEVSEITQPIEITEAQNAQIESNDGSTAELNEITTPIDQEIVEKDTEIRNVETEAKEKIEEVTDTTSESSMEKTENKELEIIKNELNSISEKVKADWESYLQSGEIEKSDLYQKAKSAIENMTPYSHEKRQAENTQIGNTTYLAKPNPGAESWRGVAQQIDDLKTMVRAKASEVLKPIHDFREKLDLGVPGLTNEDIKELTFLSGNAEVFVIRDKEKKMINDLQDMYKTKIKEYNSVLN